MFATEGQFARKKAGIVVAGSCLDDIMVGTIALYDHASSPFAAASPAGDLGQQLKGSFAAAKVGQKEPQIGCHHTDQGDQRQVQPFGDHLCPDQNICLVLCKGLQELFVAPFAAGCIGVPAQNAGSGQNFLNGCHQTFGSCPKKTNAFALAGWALCWNGQGAAAVMADETFWSVPVL